MNLIFCKDGLSIGRDVSDTKIRKESTLVFRLLKELNWDAPSLRRWVRFYPCRHGLTSSRLGVRDRLTGIIYWHGNYQVENAAEKFNTTGGVFFNKA